MVRSVQHEMLPQPTHDESSRQEFIVAFKQQINRNLRSSQRQLFEQVVAPEYARLQGRAPQRRDDVRAAMSANTAWRSWSAMHRAAQELMWVAIGDSIFRERQRLSAIAQRLHDSPSRRGSLHLDPDFVPPRGVTAVDIHLQTGGYAMDLGGGDICAGALYECGGNLYAFGQGIGRGDSKAGHVQGFIAERFPQLKPRRILDLGCSAGSASVPYALAFAEAEVHAVDVGSAMLRYAHARAESLGAAVHFHQMDCADLHFPDAYFDLVVSHNTMHEISDATRRGMMRETWRLLAPGGVAVHQDVPLRFAGRSELEKFELSWDSSFNNEPFWEVYANADLMADMLDAGIPQDCAHVGHLPQAVGSLPWYVAACWKPAQ
jgi:SAM-dependent methyltransferase